MLIDDCHDFYAEIDSEKVAEVPLDVLLRENHDTVLDIGKQYRVSCPFIDAPEHAGVDEHPSMFIWKNEKNGYCQTCHGKIYDIYDYYGLRHTPDIHGEKEEDCILELPDDMVIDLSYPLSRGISSEALYGETIFTSASLDAKTHAKTKRCYVALYKGDKLMWIEGRKIDPKQEGDRYESVKCSKKFVYPESPEVYNGCIFVVEGYYDMMNLRTHGVYNVVSEGGTNIRAEHIINIPHVKRVILLMDDDKSGRNATKVLEKGLEGFVFVENYQLTDGKDPGELTKEEIKEWIIPMIA